jgi:hypothetical protein
VRDKIKTTYGFDLSQSYLYLVDFVHKVFDIFLQIKLLAL